MGQVPPKPILKLCVAAPPVENVMRGVMRGVACGPGLCAAAKSVTKVMQGCPACVNDYARVMRGLCTRLRAGTEYFDLWPIVHREPG